MSMFEMYMDGLGNLVLRQNETDSQAKIAVLFPGVSNSDSLRIKIDDELGSIYSTTVYNATSSILSAAPNTCAVILPEFKGVAKINRTGSVTAVKEVSTEGLKLIASAERNIWEDIVISIYENAVIKHQMLLAVFFPNFRTGDDPLLDVDSALNEEKGYVQRGYVYASSKSKLKYNMSIVSLHFQRAKVCVTGHSATLQICKIEEDTNEAND